VEDLGERSAGDGISLGESRHSHFANDAVRKGTDREIEEEHLEQHQDGLSPLGASHCLGGDRKNTEDEEAVIIAVSTKNVEWS
jgi:hypothetical protein